MQRRLAASLTADVVGYSRLMAADEKGLLAEGYARGSDSRVPTRGRPGTRGFACESPPRDGLCRCRRQSPGTTDLEELEEKARREYVPAVALAWAHMAVGHLDGAFASMDKMYEQRDPELMWMNVHVIHDRLRGDPHFHELMRKIGFTESQIDQASALAGERD